MLCPPLILPPVVASPLPPRPPPPLSRLRPRPTPYDHAHANAQRNTAAAAAAAATTTTTRHRRRRHHQTVCARCSAAVGDLQPAVHCGDCQLFYCGPCGWAAVARRKNFNDATAAAVALAGDMRALALCCGAGMRLAASVVDVERLAPGTSTARCSRCSNHIADLSPFVLCQGCNAVTCAACASAMVVRARALVEARLKSSKLAARLAGFEPCANCRAQGSYGGSAVDGVHVACNLCRGLVPDLTGFVQCFQCQFAQCTACGKAGVQRYQALIDAKHKADKLVSRRRRRRSPPPSACFDPLFFFCGSAAVCLFGCCCC